MPESWDENLTPVACQACGGHYEDREEHDDGTYKVLYVCEWCTDGNMTREQSVAWARHHGIGRERRSTPR